MSKVPTVTVNPSNAGVSSITITRERSALRFSVIPRMGTSVEDIAAGIRGALADAFHAGQDEANDPCVDVNKTVD